MDPEMMMLFSVCGRIQDMILENEKLREENRRLRGEIDKAREDREEGFIVSADSHNQFVKALIRGQLTINS